MYDLFYIDIRKLSANISLLLRIFVEVIHQMQHDVVRQGAIPSHGATLSIDLVVGVGKLMQQVEDFETGDEFTFEERH